MTTLLLAILCGAAGALLGAVAVRMRPREEPQGEPQDTQSARVLAAAIMEAYARAEATIFGAASLDRGKAASHSIILHHAGGAIEQIGLHANDLVGQPLGEPGATPEFTEAVRLAETRGEASYTTAYPGASGETRTYSGSVVEISPEGVRALGYDPAATRAYAWAAVDTTELTRTIRELEAARAEQARLRAEAEQKAANADAAARAAGHALAARNLARLSGHPHEQ